MSRVHWNLVPQLVLNPPHQLLSPSLPPTERSHWHFLDCWTRNRKNTLAQLHSDAEWLRDTTALLILTLNARKAGNNSDLHFHATFSSAQGRPTDQSWNPQTVLKSLHTCYLIQNSIPWNKPLFFVFADALPNYLLNFRIGNFLKACWLYTLKA